jgi:hypothetical protein
MPKDSHLVQWLIPAYPSRAAATAAGSLPWRSPVTSSRAACMRRSFESLTELQQGRPA